MAEQTPVLTSKKHTLNLRDFLRGLLMAIVSAVLTTLYGTLQEGELVFKWKTIGLVALTTAISYLLKNFFSPSEIVIQNAPQHVVQAVKEGEARVMVKPMPESERKQNS